MLLLDYDMHVMSLLSCNGTLMLLLGYAAIHLGCYCEVMMRFVYSLWCHISLSRDDDAGDEDLETSPYEDLPVEMSHMASIVAGTIQPPMSLSPAPRTPAARFTENH